MILKTHGDLVKRNIFVFKLIKIVDKQVPDFCFGHKELELGVSFLNGRIRTYPKSKSYEELLKKHGYVTFDMVYEFGKI